MKYALKMEKYILHTFVCTILFYISSFVNRTRFVLREKIVGYAENF